MKDYKLLSLFFPTETKEGIDKTNQNRQSKVSKGYHAATPTQILTRNPTFPEYADSLLLWVMRVVEEWLQH
jgi:hypothetical protein